jgi:hypothetical protein
MLVGGLVTLLVGGLIHEKVEKPFLRYKSPRSLRSTGA